MLKFSANIPWYKRMKLLRTNAGLSQVEAAKLIGVSVRNYQRWEAGQNIPMSVYKRCIAEGFEVNEDQIFCGHIGKKAEYCLGVTT